MPQEAQRDTGRGGVRTDGEKYTPEAASWSGPVDGGSSSSRRQFWPVCSDAGLLGVAARGLLRGEVVVAGGLGTPARRSSPSRPATRTVPVGCTVPVGGRTSIPCAIHAAASGHAQAAGHDLLEPGRRQHRRAILAGIAVVAAPGRGGRAGASVTAMSPGADRRPTPGRSGCRRLGPAGPCPAVRVDFPSLRSGQRADLGVCRCLG